MVIRSIPVYSLDGLIIKENHFNKDEIPIGNSTLSFNENTITKITFWTGGKTKNKVVTDIDLEGNVLLEKKYETILQSKFSVAAETVLKYNYNQKSLKVEETQFNPWGLVDDYKERFYIKIENKYNDDMLLSESVYTKKDATIDYILTFDYKMDSNNNWIEKTIIKNGVKESQFTRVITYFKK